VGYHSSVFIKFISTGGAAVYLFVISMDMHAQGAARTQQLVALGTGVGYVQMLAFNMFTQVILGLDNFLTQRTLPQEHAVIGNHCPHACRHDCIHI
jgi:hypothetical protein